MPNYVYSCPRCGEFEQYGLYDATEALCDCGKLSKRLPCSGVQVINRTGDMGRPVTWEEKRQRENNARVQETVTNNSKQIHQETGDKTAYRQHVKR